MTSTSDEVGHTATPWKVGPDDFNEALLITSDARAEKVEIAAIDLGYVEPFESEQRANAAFIVNAVNSHDSLVKALEASADWMKLELEQIGGCDHSVGICCCADYAILADIDAALSQAKGGK